MGLLDRLFGRRPRGYDDRRDDDGHGYDPGAGRAYGYDEGPARSRHPADEQAIERYRYLLRTAPPDQIEQAHAEAFAQLTPEQRRQVLGRLGEAVPAGERPASDDPRTLARAATRAELRQPGFMERTFGGPGRPGPGYGGGYGGGSGGPGIGGMIGGSMLGTIGGLVIGTAVADALFDTGLGDGGLFGGGDEEAYAAGFEDGAGADGGDFAGGAGGDHGDYGGGDFGGGDFGGGDFGGGDF